MTQIWRHSTRNRVARSSMVLCLCPMAAGWNSAIAGAAPTASSTADVGSVDPIQLDHSQSLKALLCTVSSLLDDILGARGAFASLSDPSLRDVAHTLMDGYILFGLDPDLSSAQIAQGIEDCDIAIQFMKDHESELDLTGSEILDLDQTLDEMMLELENEL